MGNFKKDTFITFNSNIALLFLFLIFSILLNRSLGPELKGIYTFYMTIPLLLSAFLSVGLESANVYFIGKRKIHPGKLISNSLIIYMAILLILIILSFILFFFKIFPHISGYTISKVLFFLSLFSTPLIMENNFLSTIVLGLQKYTLYNILKLISVLFLIIAVAICIFIFKRVSITTFFIL